MAAEASRAPLVRERKSVAARLRQFFAPVEPWYDWGKTATIWRLDQVERDFSDESEGEAYKVELQWFGLHLGIVVGRTPPKVSAADILKNKARTAALTAQSEAL